MPKPKKPLEPTGNINPELLKTLQGQSTSDAYDPTPGYLANYIANFTPAGVLGRGAVNFGRQAGDIFADAAYEDKISGPEKWLKLLATATNTGNWANAVRRAPQTTLANRLYERFSK